jgi:hypothetical protein
MHVAVNVFRVLVPALGLTLLALGLGFWTGNVLALVGLHELLGFAMVLSLWALAVLALLGGGSRPLALLAVLWGLVMPILGIAQAGLLPGGAHWIIQALHLLVGLGAIGIGQSLARTIRRAPRTNRPSSEPVVP